MDELGNAGKVFRVYVPIDITGKFAEEVAEQLEPGDEVLVDGKPKFTSVIDAKTSQKSSKLIVSSWTVTRAPVAAAAQAEVQRC